MYTAKYKDTVLAQANADQIFEIEGNIYFHPDTVKTAMFSDSASDLHTTCHWKGTANYYDINLEGETLENAAWYYPEPLAAGVEQVGDFTGYVAFYEMKGIEITQE